MKNTEMQEINEHFSSKNIIDEIELKKYILENYPGKTDKLYRYYLTDLYKNNIFYRYDVGMLKLCRDRKQFIFTQMEDDETKKALEEIIPSIVISYWKINDLGIYMSLQTFSNIKIIETYSYATEIVVNTLLKFNKNAVLEKDYNSFIKYNNNNDEIYIVRKMNDEVPIIREGFSSTSYDNKSYIFSPKIEKIIVDIIVDDLFNTILSDEISNILVELLKRYKINMSTIRRYATKRHNWPKVKLTIESIGFDIDEGEFK